MICLNLNEALHIGMLSHTALPFAGQVLATKALQCFKAVATLIGTDSIGYKIVSLVMDLQPKTSSMCLELC